MKIGVKYRIMSLADSFITFARRNLFYIILFSAFYLLGFIIGVSLGIRAEDPRASLSAINWLIGNYTLSRLNTFLFFVLHLLVLAAAAFIFVLLTVNIYFSAVYFIVFLYMGMSCGAPIVLLFKLFGVGSIVIDIFGFVIFELLYAVFLIFFAAHMFETALENHKFGCVHNVRKLMLPLAQQFIFVAAIVAVQSFLLFVCSVFIL